MTLSYLLCIATIHDTFNCVRVHAALSPFKFATQNVTSIHVLEVIDNVKLRGIHVYSTIKGRGRVLDTACGEDESYTHVTGTRPVYVIMHAA